MIKSLILYWSSGGNTKKVAKAIEMALLLNDISVNIIEINEDMDIDLFEFDLVFFGAPSYNMLPPEPVMKYIKYSMSKYCNRQLRAPKCYGKYAVVFCTYAGIHTGINEAYTAGKYMAQFFEHLGFCVLDEWYTVGDIRGWEEGTRFGRLGDISNRPNKTDLQVIHQETLDILKGLNNY
jgi:flavorubredoxin